MSKIFYFLGHEQFQPEILVQHAQLAEDVGFDGVLVSEHFHPWVADVSAAGFAFATLGAIAQVTKKLELMTGVVTPLFRYHPAVVAQAAATIDRLSQGRFTLGIGSGESINETPLGFSFPSYNERSEKLKEATEIITQLLSGATLTFHGKYYQTTNAHLFSSPLHKVLVLIAAAGPKTATLAGEIADGIITSVKDPQKTKETVVTLAISASQQVGKKSFALVASRWSVFAQNPQEAWQALLPWRGLRAPSRDSATDPRLLQQEADILPHEEILSRYILINSPQAYIDTYAPLIQIFHAETVVIQTTSIHQEDTIRMLGEQVVPKLKEL